MILTSLREQEGKEQRHGVINARETACWKRGCPAVPPCPEEGERSHAAGVLCHHRIELALRSVPGESDAGPYETLSLAQTPEACVWPCRGGSPRLDVSLCRGSLWQEAAGSHTRAPACPGDVRNLQPGFPLPRDTAVLPAAEHGRHVSIQSIHRSHPASPTSLIPRLQLCLCLDYRDLLPFLLREPHSHCSLLARRTSNTL